MQSIASLMSIDRVSDIGNVDDIDEEYDLESSKETSAKINELTSQFGLLGMGESDDIVNTSSNQTSSGTFLVLLALVLCNTILHLPQIYSSSCFTARVEHNIVACTSFNLMLLKHALFYATDRWYMYSIIFVLNNAVFPGKTEMLRLCL